MSSCPTVRVVAIAAGHLSFAQRMVIRHAQLRILSLVAAKASVVRYRSALDKEISLRGNEIHIPGAVRRRVESSAALVGRLDRGSMDLVAINAANSICGVYSSCPMPGALILCVTAQAYAVCVCGGALPERDNFGGVTPAIDMKAAISVALLALDTLLRVISMLEVFGNLRMAGGASLRSDRLGAWDIEVFCEGCEFMCGLLCR